MNLNTLLINILLTIYAHVIAIENKDTSDYVKLITTELAKALTYKERVNNEDLYSDATSKETKDFGEFEYIIIGAGTSGSVVAKKLAENRFKTLLIEAGANETEFTDIPAMFRQLQFSDHNWGYYTTPQQHSCQGMINKQCAFPRGKVMGGTSTIGGLTYARGNELDQDRWSYYGIDSWTWKDVLPYYKIIENYTLIKTDQFDDYHGFMGPMPIDFARPSNQLEHIFLSANEEFYKVTQDINGPKYMAAGRVQFMKKNGRRISSAKAYLTPTPQYLTITTLSYAYKILFDDNKIARSVLFMKNGQQFRARAKYEIILSGGSINTPLLLMLSGIGPKDELHRLGIPVIADLPVGTNLVGHIGFHGLQFKSDLKLYDRNKTFIQHISDYQSGIGTLANVAIDGISFLSTTMDKKFADIEIFLSHRAELNVTAMNEWHFDKSTLDEYTIPNEELEYTFRIAILVIKAHSKGNVTLKSNNPKDFPLIDINSLSDERDIDKIYRGIKYIMQLLESVPFKDLNTKLLKRVLPACKDYPYLSKKYWYCTIKHVSGTANHPVGTCRMGEGRKGVVDSKLNVKGVRSLRVADLSVAPRVNSLHTNALALVVGERAADFVIQYHWEHFRKGVFYI